MLRWERPALGRLRVVVESRLAVCNGKKFAATPDGNKRALRKVPKWRLARQSTPRREGPSSKFSPTFLRGQIYLGF